MKLLFDFLPIFVFFVAFKFFGIYVATATAMAVSFIQVAYHVIRYRTLPGLQLLSLGVIVVFGGSTLLLHNEMFIKWKPSVLNWILALLFLGNQLLKKKLFVERLMGSNITLPPAIWRQLNMAWALFFTVMGILNIVVAYHFSTNTWVNFKLFGILGSTLVFVVLQALYLARYITPDESEKL